MLDPPEPTRRGTVAELTPSARPLVHLQLGMVCSVSSQGGANAPNANRLAGTNLAARCSLRCRFPSGGVTSCGPTRSGILGISNRGRDFGYRRKLAQRCLVAAPTASASVSAAH